MRGIVETRVALRANNESSNTRSFCELKIILNVMQTLLVRLFLSFFLNLITSHLLYGLL